MSISKKASQRGINWAQHKPNTRKPRGVIYIPASLVRLTQSSSSPPLQLRYAPLLRFSSL